MKITSSLVLPARLENLPAFIASAASAAESCGLEPEKRFNIELALEEVLVNIISHACEGTEGDIGLTFGTDSRHLFVIEIADRGEAFDVTAVPPPDLEADLESRKIGGLGIHFLRTLTDEVVYRREGTKNVLRLCVAPGTVAMRASEP